MMKHTQGPWRIGDAGRTVFGPPNGNPSPETIAHLGGKHNARLIAAAPDLLAALEAMYYTLANDGRIEIAGPAYAQARAAIAKARP